MRVKDQECNSAELTFQLKKTWPRALEFDALSPITDSLQVNDLQLYKLPDSLKLFW